MKLKIGNKSKTESLETPREVDMIGALSNVDKMEDDSILSYMMLIEQFPDWESVLQDIIEEEIKHKGQIQALRESITEQTKKLLEEGKAEGNNQLEDIFVDNTFSQLINEENLSESPSTGEDLVIKLLNNDSIQY